MFVSLEVVGVRSLPWADGVTLELRLNSQSSQDVATIGLERNFTSQNVRLRASPGGDAIVISLQRDSVSLGEATVAVGGSRPVGLQWISLTPIGAQIQVSWSFDQIVITTIDSEKASLRSRVEELEKQIAQRLETSKAAVAVRHRRDFEPQPESAPALRAMDSVESTGHVLREIAAYPTPMPPAECALLVSLYTGGISRPLPGLERFYAS